MIARLGLVLAVVGVLSTPAHASLPVAPAVKVLVRILSYDRALSARVGGPVRVAIVFDARDPLSVEQSRDAQAALRTLGGTMIDGLPLVPEATMIPAGPAAAGQLSASGAVIVCRGVDGIRELASAADELNLILLTLDDGLMAQGPAVGVAQREARLEILIDMAAARLQGVDLSSEVLEVAHLVGSSPR